MAMESDALAADRGRNPESVTEGAGPSRFPLPDQNFETVPAPRMLYLLGVSYALAGVIISSLLARHYVGALGVSITALGLVEITQKMFKRHRDLSWSEQPEFKNLASTELIRGLFAVLLGIITAFVIFGSFLRREAMQRLFSFQINGVFMEKAIGEAPFFAHFGFRLLSGLVLVGLSFMLAAIYKEAGIALIMSWIGSLWGIGLVLSFGKENFSFVTVALLILSLAANSTGFLISGATGLFLGRGALKYPIRSPQYRAVVQSSLLLFAAAVSLMICSAVISAVVAVGVG